MGRAPCCEKSGLKKGPWTPEEDQKLIDYIQKHGYGNWRTLPKNAGLQRCGKSCRLRWTNYLRPDIKRGRFSFEEEETIIQLHSILGNKWSAIASRLPGRTDNEIKNYWNTHIRKRLLRMGIDPVTHSLRLDLLDLSSLLSSSLYSNSSQPNIQRFLGMQPLVNPELLKLASSLFQSQNNQQNQLFNPQIQSQIPHFATDPVQEIPASLPLTEAEAQLMVEPNVDAYQSNFTDFDWQGNGIASSSNTLTEDYVPQIPSYNFYSSDNQNLMSEASNFQYSNGSNQNFSLASVLSTPSSSPTPLNSNSTYVNSSSTEDDREISYGGRCDDILFEIPNILDVNEFM
ncbi:hypothetical protein L6164_036549 [Bauhinia variegata]|uniref:Uncharacterized protein n=1 Tax=Bauhinia variegata TaxID=167791 RepID=A0ACB9KHD4_BAUVA|nr:hypothetical protein L6164_036549 [Bauhinia variegata]